VIDIKKDRWNPGHRTVTGSASMFSDPTGELVPRGARVHHLCPGSTRIGPRSCGDAMTRLQLVDAGWRGALSNNWSGASVYAGRIATTSARHRRQPTRGSDFTRRCDSRQNVHALHPALWDSARASAAASSPRLLGLLRSRKVGSDVKTVTAPTKRRPDSRRPRVGKLAIGTYGRDPVSKSGLARGRRSQPASRRGTGSDSDGRVQYFARVASSGGLFLEVYNLLNRANFGNPTGARTRVIS
jgi:hypothetical protein